MSSSSAELWNIISILRNNGARLDDKECRGMTPETLENSDEPLLLTEWQTALREAEEEGKDIELIRAGLLKECFSDFGNAELDAMERLSNAPVSDIWNKRVV